MTGIPGFWAVIPAGGSGTRLWPISRRQSPKFLHDLTGSGQSLLRATWDRSSDCPDPVRSCRNFGELRREMGHSRVPEPPAGITAQKPGMPVMGDTVPTRPAMPEPVGEVSRCRDAVAPRRPLRPVQQRRP